MFRCTSSRSSDQTKLPASISRDDLRHAALDVGEIVAADDSLLGEHGGVRQRAADVLPPHARSKSTEAV
jgi:hypothetical protein